MKAETIDSVRSLQHSLEAAEKRVAKLRSRHINSQSEIGSIRELVDVYFRTVRQTIVDSSSSGDFISETDLSFHELLELTHKRSKVTSYRSVFRTLKGNLLELEKSVLLSGTTSNSLKLDPTDNRIISTLTKLLPSAALSYEQAALDLKGETRLSWRGPATDLREALREVLDHLAPDGEVEKQPGFSLERDAKGPTMKQKVRHVLRKRGLSRGSTEVSERATESVEEIVGGFVRSVYTRSNISTHTPTDKAEVIRVRDWVRTALCELLAL